MTKHPAGRHVQKEDTAPDDAFIARVLEVSNWAKRNLRAVIIGAVAFTVLVAGVIYYRNQQATVRTQAAIELMNLRMAANRIEEQQLVVDLQNFLQRYDGTAAADEARVVLGQAYLQLGQANQAIELLGEQARRPDRPLGASAAFLLAAAYEESNRAEDAEAVYLRIADRVELGFQKREALDHAARIRLDRTDAAGAADLYERVIATISEAGPERSFYEMRLEEARTRALTAATSTES